MIKLEIIFLKQFLWKKTKNFIQYYKCFSLITEISNEKNVFYAIPGEEYFIIFYTRFASFIITKKIVLLKREILMLELFLLEMFYFLLMFEFGLRTYKCM